MPVASSADGADRRGSIRCAAASPSQVLVPIAAARDRRCGGTTAMQPERHLARPRCARGDPFARPTSTELMRRSCGTSRRCQQASIATRRCGQRWQAPRTLTLPRFVVPAAPRLVTSPPAGPDWLHEPKLDGGSAADDKTRRAGRIVSWRHGHNLRSSPAPGRAETVTPGPAGWVSTSACTDATAAQSIEFCNRVAELNARVSEATSVLDRGSAKEADPQAALISRITGHDDGPSRSARVVA